MTHSGFYFVVGSRVKPVRVQTSLYMGNFLRLVFFQSITREGNLDEDTHFSPTTTKWNAHKERVSKLKSLYSLTSDEAEFVILNRVGPCEICGKDAKRHLDHDHETGLVRGFLCSGCNRALGYLENDEWVTKARSYLNGD